MFRHQTWPALAALLLTVVLAGCSSGTTSPASVQVPPTNPASSVQKSTSSTSHIGTIEHLLSPGGYLDGLAVSAGTLWATDLDGNRVIRVSLANLHRKPDIAVPDGPLAVVADRGAVWVASYQGNIVTRLDARSGDVTATVMMPSQGPCGLAPVAKGLWIFDQSDGAGVLVDSVSGAILRKVMTSAHSGLASSAFGSVWVPDFTGSTGSVERLANTTGKHQATIKTGQGPLMTTSGAGSVWVANATSNTVTRIDPSTGHIQAQITIPASAPVSVLVTQAAAWVTGYSSNTLYRVDLSTNRVTGHLLLPGPPENLVFAGGLLWVTMTNGQLAGIATSS